MSLVCLCEFNVFLFRVVGVLKSVLQIFFGVFAFNHLSINYKTIIGILLSLIGGTMFSYFEYTNKQSKTINSDEKSEPILENK